MYPRTSLFLSVLYWLKLDAVESSEANNLEHWGKEFVYEKDAEGEIWFSLPWKALLKLELLSSSILGTNTKAGLTTALDELKQLGWIKVKEDNANLHWIDEAKVDAYYANLKK